MQNWAEIIERDLLALEDMMDVVENGHGEHGSEDGDDQRDSDTDLNGAFENGTVNGQNGYVDVDANGKKVDQSAKGWLKWW